MPSLLARSRPHVPSIAPHAITAPLAAGIRTLRALRLTPSRLARSSRPLIPSVAPHAITAPLAAGRTFQASRPTPSTLIDRRRHSRFSSIAPDAIAAPLAAGRTFPASRLTPSLLRSRQDALSERRASRHHCSARSRLHFPSVAPHSLTAPLAARIRTFRDRATPSLLRSRHAFALSEHRASGHHRSARGSHPH